MPQHTFRRMLLAGRDAARLATDLATVLPVLETRTVAHGPLSAEDAAWADSYTGFTVPPDLADSGVRWFHLPMAGVDRVVEDLAGRDVVLTRTVGGMPAAIGSYVLAHLLADAWRLREYAAQQLEARWEPLPSPRVAGRTVVVLGTGEIGAGVAGALRGAGYRVVGVNTRGTPAAAFDDVVALSDIGSTLASCTALVNALPLTDDTRGLLDASLLERLDGAVVVNVGRGASLVPDDLRCALDSGRVRRAVLDVHETEPLPAEDWRWTHPRVTVTPHVSGPTEPEDVVEAVVAAHAALAAGRTPPHVVDLGRGY
ncbi:glyoxylate/hydroxypyruvate reductase A [Georgenia satyanarayanai]|uniref:Glyoxylate/hydroxypyruvate reductase A n=1 Tax=Georgenia satyanarayanai TaxID=860221 RepID=A0A2Y9ANU9_9MICO|nr:NAD(P)-dependent oxidoreductase [Georgenia satyanarayanai]PYF97360.1 glyoxylate/hydroxypyruvate reductase A [Georgenia satyanarayanai]SSA46141.1 glyoxylate/hydroxypyruvate reductase A [Georgenia satyanarayanai]